MYSKSWKKQVQKNWKIWLISLVMSLGLIGRGVGSAIRPKARLPRRHQGLLPL